MIGVPLLPVAVEEAVSGEEGSEALAESQHRRAHMSNKEKALLSM